MGIGVTVSCPCFGSFALQVGMRMAPPQYCLFPFLCTECLAATTLDIYAESFACSQCGSEAVVPYGSAPALGQPGATVVFAASSSDKFSAEQLTITDGTYWCPTCRNYTLRFSDSGILWD